MNLTYKALLLTVGVLSFSTVHASTIGVALTNETIQGDANINMDTFGIDVGAAHDTDEKASSGYLGLSVQDSEGESGPLEIGIGVRLYAIDANRIDDSLSAALSLGGWYRYTLPEANRISIYASLYYAPKVLSFSNLDHMHNTDIRLEYMTMRNARAFIRYGNTVGVYNDNSRTEINKGFSVGATVSF